MRASDEQLATYDWSDCDKEDLENLARAFTDLADAFSSLSSLGGIGDDVASALDEASGHFSSVSDRVSENAGEIDDGYDPNDARLEAEVGAAAHREDKVLTLDRLFDDL